MDNMRDNKNKDLNCDNCNDVLDVDVNLEFAEENDAQFINEEHNKNRNKEKFNNRNKRNNR